MFIKLQTKLWLAILSIVLMFTFFTLFYFPAQQTNILFKNYNQEVQNFANTVALGVQIALTEENYKGALTAMEYVKTNPAFKFVCLVQADTVWDKAHNRTTVQDKIIKAYPADVVPVLSVNNNQPLIIKRSPVSSSIMAGDVVLAFSTREIEENKKIIRTTSLIVSIAIFVIGLLIGILLSRKISKPVIALRNAARLVGEGDLTQRVKTNSKDEIGDLANAFNTMVSDLEKTRTELYTSNRNLSDSNSALSNTLNELKATQTQLIQSEKMASLGELTAGIAHEIQNPLNFVNNFAEVSIELAEELKEALLKTLAGKLPENVAALTDDLIQNQQKINFHGKRAGSIVKGMLQHSRRSNGQKELTDINRLADEYLRLSYHGLRAKDKAFNAAIETDFDEQLGKINILPQELGRVLINLYTNAFYAVMHKKQTAGSDYMPAVYVKTKGEKGSIKIFVKDNGDGIPAGMRDKIFQPFFTTKPTGEGTGLGLSLSYDIITKGHGGALKVQSEEGEYAEFIIQLPAGQADAC